jgi:hypothetical protein
MAAPVWAVARGGWKVAGWQKRLGPPADQTRAGAGEAFAAEAGAAVMPMSVR